MSDPLELLSATYDSKPNPIVEKKSTEPITIETKPITKTPLTSVLNTDPFVVTPVKKPQEIKYNSPVKPINTTTKKPEQVKEKKPLINKLTVILISVIIILIVSIVILICLTPRKTKREIENLTESYLDSQKQLKDYQLKIQQLENDNKEINNVYQQSTQQLQNLKEELEKKKQEEMIIQQDIKSFNTKPKTRQEQKTEIYKKAADPTVIQQQPVNVPKFKDVGEDEITPVEVEDVGYNQTENEVIEEKNEESIDLDDFM